jgi:hypothetical protein
VNNEVYQYYFDNSKPTSSDPEKYRIQWLMLRKY